MCNQLCLFFCMYMHFRGGGVGVVLRIFTARGKTTLAILVSKKSLACYQGEFARNRTWSTFFFLQFHFSSPLPESGKGEKMRLLSSFP